MLDGVAPPHFMIIPLEDARGAQGSMTRLIAECKADAKCNVRFPSFGAHFTRYQRFDRGSVSVPLENSKTKRVTIVSFRRMSLPTGCASFSIIQ